MQDMTWRGFSNVKRARFADIKTELRLLQMQLRNRWNQHQIQICLKIIPESFLTNKNSRFASIALFPTSTNMGKMQSNYSIESNSLSFMWEDAFGSSSNCCCVQFCAASFDVFFLVDSSLQVVVVVVEDAFLFQLTHQVINSNHTAQ